MSNKCNSFFRQTISETRQKGYRFWLKYLLLTFFFSQEHVFTEYFLCLFVVLLYRTDDEQHVIYTMWASPFSYISYINEFRVAIEKITTIYLSALGGWGLTQTRFSFRFNRFIVEFLISLSLLRVSPGIIWERWTFFLTGRYLKEYIKYYFFALKNEIKNVLKFGANHWLPMKRFLA